MVMRPFFCQVFNAEDAEFYAECAEVLREVIAVKLKGDSLFVEISEARLSYD